MLIDLLTAEYQYHLLGVCAAVSAGIMVALGLVILSLEKGHASGWYFLIFTVPLTIWVGGTAGTYFAVDTDIAMHWGRITEFGVAFIPPAFFLIVTVILHSFHRHKNTLYAGTVLSSIFAVLALTHPDYISGVNQYDWGKVVKLEDIAFLFLVYFALFVGYSFKLLGQEVKSASNDAQRGGRISNLFIAFSVGSLSCLDFLAPFGINFLPLGFIFVTFTFIHISFIAIKFRLEDITLEEVAVPVFKNMADPIFVIDGKGIVKLTNCAGHKLFFPYDKDPREKPLLQTIVDKHFAAKCLDRAIIGRDNESTIEFVDNNGDSLYLQPNITSIKNRNRQVMAYVYIFHDMTTSQNTKKQLITSQNELEYKVNERTQELQLEIINHKRTEKALKLAKQKAEISSNAKSEFVSTISHELRTPLNGITGVIELLKDTQLNNVQKEHLQILENSSTLLLNLISDILDFSRIESNKMDIHTSKIAIHKTIKHMHKLFLYQAKEKNISFDYSISDNVPRNILSDEKRIKQILVNLIANAIKFTKSGGVKIVVETENLKLLKFTITDSGIGMSETDTHLIFDSFYQADQSNSRGYEGSGLGLSITKKLVNLLGGDIGVISHLDVGSSFWFTIPLQIAAKNSEVPTPTPIPIPIKDENIEQLHELRVLLVEDNIVNQKVASAFLKKLGIQTIFANNGQEAVDLVEEEAFDLILMDIQMPVMDGITATQHIRRIEVEENRPETPIIALTANASEESRRDCLAAGMNDFVSKPFQRERVNEVISTWSKAALKKQ